MKGEKMKIKDLRPADYNPRKISKEKMIQLQKALEEFGNLSGIIFNKQTGNLIGGHQRLKCIPKNAEITITDNYNPPTSKGTIAEGFILLYGGKHNYREVD